MSDATTALAEAIWPHDQRHDAYGDVEGCWCGWLGSGREYAHHLAAAVVAAVRGLSPDLQAELIGGEVERTIIENRRGYEFTTVMPPRHAAARVVGPWTPEQAEEAAS